MASNKSGEIIELENLLSELMSKVCGEPVVVCYMPKSLLPDDAEEKTEC